MAGGGLSSISEELGGRATRVGRRWGCRFGSPPHMCGSEWRCPPGLEGDALLQELARHYVAAMEDMEGRKPGPSSILGTCGALWGEAVGAKLWGQRPPPSPPLLCPTGTSQLRPGEPHGYRIPFNPTGTGCGAAMRSLAIGLRSGCGSGAEVAVWG